MMVGWRDLIRDQLAVSGERSSTSTTGSPTATSRVGFGPDVHPLLIAAARARGISIAGYIRRATMAFVADDLGLNPLDLYAADLAVSPFGKGGTAPSKDLDGELYGQWRMHGGNEPRDPDA